MVSHLGRNDRRLRALLVLEASGGGTGRHVLELSQGLAARDWEVHVVYSPLRAEQSFIQAIESLTDVYTLQLPMHRAPHPSDIACMTALRRYMRAHGGFDILHAHSSKAGALGRMAAAGEDVVRVYTPHAMRTIDPTLEWIPRQFYRLIEFGLARTLSDAIICVSSQERDHIIKLKIAPPSLLHVVPNGIPPIPSGGSDAIRNMLGLRPENICLGFIGRLVPQKAPERFVRAVHQVCQRFPTARGIVLGGGPLEAELHALAERLGIQDRLVWIANCAGSAVVPAFDVLLMPSLYEGMPYVLLEALAAGVPVLATNVGGVSEAVENGATGFVVANDEDLAKKALLLAQDTDLRKSMASRSLSKSREMSVDRMVDDTTAVYREALRTHAMRAGHRIPRVIDVAADSGGHRPI